MPCESSAASTAGPETSARVGTSGRLLPNRGSDRLRHKARQEGPVLLKRLIWKPHRFECPRCGYKVRLADAWALAKISQGHDCDEVERN